MRVVYNAPPFLFIESLWSSDQVITLEVVLSCPADEDEDYRRVKDKELTSTLDPVSLGLVLVGLMLSPFEETTTPKPPPIEPRPKESQGNDKANTTDK